MVSAADRRPFLRGRPLADTDIDEPWKELARLADAGEADELGEYLDALPGNDVAIALSRLSDDQQTKLLTALPADAAAEVVGHLPSVQAAEVVGQLTTATAAAIVDELPSDEQADLLGDLDSEDAAAILAQMDPAEAADARSLVRYADDVAGGLMVTEFLRYGEDLRVADVVTDMQQHADAYRDYDVQYAYVCADDGRLTGVLRLRDLLLARRTEQVSDLMIRQPLSVSDDATLNELTEFFESQSYVGVPVTNAAGRLVGVVRQSAVAEARGERQESAFLKTQGIVGGEEIRSLPLWRRSSRRLSWLSINIVLNVIAASIIAVYQETLSEVIALAVFLPIISDMSGCSGNQAVAVSLRELSLGLVRANDVMRVWLKEVSLGLINGLILGCMIGVIGAVWQGNGYFGLVAGTALCLNTMIAVSVGGVVPLLVTRLGMDPAIASGPILTTITDMIGFFLVLALATMMLAHLV